MDPASGSGKIQFLSHCNEVFQMPEFHAVR
jgi:hypothetical protein